MKRYAWVVILLMIIALAVVWGIRKAGRGGVPNWVLGEMIKKTDTQSKESITLPRSEWEKLTSQQLLATACKNPKTGCNYKINSTTMAGSIEMIALREDGSEVRVGE